jgi:serine/threonine protein phosphatase PrpC
VQRNLKISAYTHLGHQRKTNEDSICIGRWVCNNVEEGGTELELNSKTPVCLAVADGIGGQIGGEVASAIVVKNLSNHAWKSPLDHSINDAVQDCEKAIRNEMRKDPQLKVMGTTLAGVVLYRDCYFHFNIGDSRVYSHSNGELTRLSIDDVRLPSGALTQSIGGTPGILPQKIETHLGNRTIGKNEILLICSDGLTDMVDEDELANLLGSDSTLSARPLVNRALSRGGFDNISVLLVRS